MKLQTCLLKLSYDNENNNISQIKNNEYDLLNKSC